MAHESIENDHALRIASLLNSLNKTFFHSYQINEKCLVFKRFAIPGFKQLTAE